MSGQKAAFSRRALLAGGATAAAAMALPGLAGAIPLTPQQVKGPYYPLRRELAARTGILRDRDLCRVGSRAGTATGTHLLLSGAVTDADGRPISGAVVEIWQACTSGRYLNAHDTRAGRPRDPDFQYFGVCPVDDEGRYAFRTLVPPEYPAGPPGWIRPPHIHVKVVLPDGAPLITQMYFDDPANPANADINLLLHRRDSILNSVRPALRDLLVRPVTLLADTLPQDGPGAELVAGIGLADFGDAARAVHFPIVPRSEIALP